MIGELLGIVAPTFLVALAGYLWLRFGSGFDRALVTDLIMNVGAPALVFSELVTLASGAEEILGVAGLSLLALGLCAGVGAVVLTALGLRLNTYLAPVMFSNTGNLGMPLCLFALGEEGLALGVVFFAVHAITHFTLGVAIWSGQPTLREPLTNPLALAALAATLVRVAGIELPRFVIDTTRLLGGFTIPLMLMTLGASIAELEVARLPRSLGLSAFRLGLGACVGLFLSWAFALEGVARGVVLIQCAMPVAVFNYLMSERYGRAPDEIASLVVLSTLLAFALLPVWLAFVL